MLASNSTSQIHVDWRCSWLLANGVLSPFSEEYEERSVFLKQNFFPEY